MPEISLPVVAGPQFDLGQFALLNWARCADKKGFDCSEKDNLYWIAAMLEELGEIAGAVKKLSRGFNKRERLKMLKKYTYMSTEEWTDDAIKLHWLSDKRKALADEVSDLYIYMDLFNSANGINIWEAIRNKFNRVSDEMELPQYKL